MTIARVLVDHNTNRTADSHNMKTKSAKLSTNHRHNRVRRAKDAAGPYKQSFRNRRWARHEGLRALRERLAQVAQDTFRTVLTTHGYHEDVLTDSDDDTDSNSSRRESPVTQERVYHDLTEAIARTRNESLFYAHYSPLLANWEQEPSGAGAAEGQTAPNISDNPTPANPEIPSSSTYNHTCSTKIEFTSLSVLEAARKTSQSSPAFQRDEYGLGVLNDASPKRPGGASLSGGMTLEERLVRQTTLFDSLQNSNAGVQFYAEHRRTTDGSGLHDHAMLYSPKVAVIKNDRGQHIAPFFIDVVSCVPVHAGTVRAKFSIDDTEFKDGVRKVMRERMARALRLFEERGDRVLILCAFGVGQSCNSPEMVGDIWADLLCARGAKFQGVFDRVVFALPAKHRETFEKSFNEKVLEKELFTEDFD